MNESYLKYAQRVDKIVSERSGIALMNPFTPYMREMYDHQISEETAAENIMEEYNII